MRTTKYGLQASDMCQRDELELKLKLGHHDTEQNKKKYDTKLIDLCCREVTSLSVIF
jgi:hypothetical protein